MDENFTPFKIEYHDPLDNTRVVSQTYLQSPAQTPLKLRKINCDVLNGINEIAIKRNKNEAYFPDEVGMNTKKYFFVYITAS